LKIDTNTELTPLSIAYMKARNADPMSSFGDFIALSDLEIIFKYQFTMRSRHHGAEGFVSFTM
jgi:hypothetical protein